MKIDEMMILLLKIILRKYFKQNSINKLLNYLEWINSKIK